ncbi:type II secretion system F family protein [Kineosporia sp. J2-2]|uniref:Type II secretion system F family protein n=1 Tax=Kineosporia corallincola TaxID=2835133 RepID=A0ABS5TPZ1_9ACTN|nr:type II secretion system F family protein [Kineosporia corallincola]MBT0772256.1 type II secretion system F family protein [Kineosporia corallincola]
MIESLSSSAPFAGVLLAGALAGGGLALLIDALIRRERGTAGTDDRSLGRRASRRLRGFGTRLPIAVLAGVFTLLVTAWPVAAIAAVTMILAWPALMGGAREERQQADRLEALALWTESLRDTIAGAVGLEQAVIATSRAAPAPIADEIITLADRLRVRVPLPTALHRLADDLDDASADLVVAALLLNSRLRGPGLRHVLTSLADSVRAEVEMRGRVTAGRAATRRSVQIVVAVTLLFVLGLRTFNPGYVEPYQHPGGQVVLAIVVGFFGAGFFWLKQLASYDLPERFMHTAPSAEGGAR